MLLLYVENTIAVINVGVEFLFGSIILWTKAIHTWVMAKCNG